MALLSTIFKIPTRAQVGFLKLDASISESHKRTATVSDNEVEDGVVVSDHVRLAPKSLSLTGQVSSNPVSILGLGVSSDDILGAAKDFTGGDKNAFTSLKDSFLSQFKTKKNASLEELVKRPNRTPKEAWDYLNELLENRIPFSIVTGLQRYENMILTSLSSPRSSSDGKSVLFTAELREIVVVESATVKIPAFKIKGDAANSASSKGDLGKQSSKEATGKQGDDSSLLLKGFKKVGIF
jgi:hypothetical protein